MISNMVITTYGVQLASYGKVGCGEAAMQSEILQRGPITCSIGTDDSFVYSYRHGVYQGPNSTDIDHDVEVRLFNLCLYSGCSRH